MIFKFNGREYMIHGSSRFLLVNPKTMEVQALITDDSRVAAQLAKQEPCCTLVEIDKDSDIVVKDGKVEVQ
jgi:hypothetical protein